MKWSFFYSRNEQQNLATTFTTPFGSTGSLVTSESNLITNSFSLRYGIFDDIQFFANVPIIYNSETASIGASELASSSETYFGDINLGFRYAALKEGWGYPSVILSLDSQIPVDTDSYSIGGSIALTKSIDPAVLFANIGYKHRFNDKSDLGDLSKLQPDNRFNVSLGIAYALNDTLTMSTSISGAFSTQTNFNNDIVLPATERFSLQFGLTAFIADGLYVEPTVAFGLNGVGSDVTFGLNVPYTF